MSTLRVKSRIILLVWFVFMNIGLAQASLRLGGNTVSQVFGDAEVVALINAAMEGRAGDVSRLAAQGVKVDEVGSDGTTPLIWALNARNAKGVEALLKVGANPNLVSEKLGGLSPMALLAGGNSLELLELILRYGGDAKGTGLKRSMKPLDRAAREGRLQNVTLIVAAGADVNDHDEYGKSAAIAAAALANFEVVAWLLEHGYTYDLRKLAMYVEVSQVPPDSEAQLWKNTVIDMLKVRGVKFPAFVKKTS
ncbi:ankyrin repeat domain-containing protein [Pseudomonas kilonensis]|uniref:ankyrin repeat domain-containing protein n=1 Tax=Pseudomonas kilonensis TaxID=132476 RepID=UPI000464E088|nr:ankyrin repeat domain-containing protein [Pseudomonas kilonensis]